MRSDPRIVLLCVCLLLSGRLVAECAKGQDHRRNQSTGIQIVEITITGTQGMSSDDLAGLEGKMMGGCYNDDSDEIEERVRALFRDRGYFRAEVQALHITPLDPLKTPKLVKVEAEIVEGERFRLKDIAFTGNHHFSAEQLRKAFPLKENELFEQGRIAGGLEGMRKLYSSEGYIDVVMIPNISFAGSGVHMNVEVREGPQYHMGKMDVFAKKELAERLRAVWDLEEGKVYDAGYPNKFMDVHHDLLPANFSSSDVQIVRNCPDAIVDVRFVIEQVEAAFHPANPVECEETQDNKP
jgi:Surface antigen variable number repeat